MKQTATLFLLFLFVSVPAWGQQQDRPSVTLSAEEMARLRDEAHHNSLPIDQRPAALPLPVTPQQIRSSLSPAERRRLHPLFQSVLAHRRLHDGPQRLQQARDVAQATGGTLVPVRSTVLHDAIVYTDAPSAVEATGTHVSARFEGFVTARFTTEELALLAQSSAVEHITPGSTNYPTNDVSVPATGAHLLHGGYIGGAPIQGEGALVCVFDSGIDIQHEDFIDPEGNTRILSLWDQTISSNSNEDPNAQPGEQAPDPYGYGVEYTQADINDEIDGNPAGFVRQRDLNGHGTHVAGSAAGDGSAYNDIYKGMAPQADLLIVKGGNGSFSESNIINGLSYCNQRANEQGRPVVVNLSLGGHSGPHDGTRTYEQYIDLLSGQPGRAVVAAAGNEGTSRIHVGGEVAPGDTYSIQFEVPVGYTPVTGAYNDFFLFDGWWSGHPQVEATVTAPAIGDTIAAATFAPFQSGNAPSDTAGTIFYGSAVDSTAQINGGMALGDPDGSGIGALNTYLQVFDGPSSQPPAAGTWTLAFENQGDATVRFDGWLYATSGGIQATTLVDGDTQQTVGMPATSRGAISVANYVTRAGWPANDGTTYYFRGLVPEQINASSSRGPTRDQRLKPDLAAPGSAIASSLSQDTGTPLNSPLVVTGGEHVIKNGTSMAAPHVAGAAALLLAEDAFLTGPTVKQLLTETAVQDDYTGISSNTTWGAGKLSALRAAVQLLGEDLPSANRRRYRAAEADSARARYALTGDRRLAIQVTPETDGILSGLLLDVASQGERGPGVKGTGTLQYAVYDNENGLPGSPMTRIFSKGFAQIAASTENFFSLLGEKIDVEPLQTYHVVFYTENPSDTLEVYADVTSNSDRTAVFSPEGNASTAALSAASGPQPSMVPPPAGTWMEAPYALSSAVEVTESRGVQVLPVELSHFAVAVQGKAAVLTWRTLTETNNDHFEVRHRLDEGFSPVGTHSGVEGGTTNEPQSYRFRVADLSPGTHTFQLRQVDINGTATVLGEKRVQVGVAGTYEMSPLYPNPFRREARFTLSVSTAQDVAIEVFDVRGRRVQVLHDGPLVEQQRHVFTLRESGLASGLYFIRVQGEKFSEATSATLIR